MLEISSHNIALRTDTNQTIRPSCEKRMYEVCEKNKNIKRHNLLDRTKNLKLKLKVKFFHKRFSLKSSKFGKFKPVDSYKLYYYKKVC